MENKTFVLANADQRRLCDQTQIQAIEAPSIAAIHAVSCLRGWVEGVKPANAKKLWRQGECQFWGQV